MYKKVIESNMILIYFLIYLNTYLKVYTNYLERNL